jgi:HK97 family phage major capsid protein
MTTERNEVQTRVLTFDIDARDAASNGIPVVVSTDSVVDVNDGPEILMHTPDAVDLRRAPLPILAGHGNGQVNVGIIDNIGIQNGQMRGIAHFGSRPEAAGYREDVLNRIIRSVSVGYARLRGKVRSDGVLVTSRWMPTHAAMVAEPADINAGFFRTRSEQSPFEIEYESNQISVREDAVGQPAPNAITRGATMSDATQSTTAGAGDAAQPVQATRAAEATQSAVDIEKGRRNAILNLSKANRIDERITQHWILSGASFETVSRELLEVLQERSKDAPQSGAHLDMSAKEVRRYSLMRALRASCNGDWKDAGLEREANQSVAKRIGRDPSGARSFFVPLDVQEDNRVQQRDLIVATTTAGGFLKATNNMSFVELLRNRMVLSALGVTRMSGLVGNVTIPKQTAAATGYWLSDEATAITESQQTFAQLALTPRTVGAFTQISRLLMLQSSPDAESLVMSDLAKVVAIAVDLAGIAGTGTEQPTGLINTANIGGVTGTSLAAAGILEFQSDVAANNALSPSCAYLTTPVVAALLMARPELPTTGTTRMWTGNLLDGNMLGFRSMSSQQCPTGDMIFGDWSQIIVGEWGVLELATSDSAITVDFQKGITSVRAFYTVDVGVRYPGAFSLATSVT